MLIGHSWLHKHNPEVNWKTSQITLSCCPPSCQEPSLLTTPQVLPTRTAKVGDEEECILQPGDGIFAFYLPDKEEAAHLRATFSHSQQLAQEAVRSILTGQGLEDLVPRAYWEFKDVFSKDAFDKLPMRKPWDHGIELLPGAEPQYPKPSPCHP